MIHFAKRATKHFLIWVIILGAVGSTSLRIFLTEIDKYKKQLELKISKVLDAPVEIGTMSAKMRGFEPELVLKEIHILARNDEQSAPQFREIRLGVDFLDVLQTWQLATALRLSFVGAKLSVVRRKDGNISIEGLKANDEEPLWIMEGGHYEVLDSEISWHDELHDTAIRNFEHVNISLKNAINKDFHQANIVLRLPDSLGDSLTFAMQFSGDIFKPGSINGQAYLKVDDLQLAELIRDGFLSEAKLVSAQGDLEIWSEYQNSKLTLLHGNVALQKAVFVKPNGKKYAIDYLTAVILLQRQQAHWQIDIRDLLLITQAQSWPQSNLSIRWQQDQQHGFNDIAVAVSALDLEKLSEISMYSGLFNDRDQKFLAQLKLKGVLQDLVLFADFQRDKFAINTRIAGLNIAPVDDFPGVENFSAVIKGTEQSGMLQMESENTVIKIPKAFSKALNAKQLNGKVFWQKSAQNWEVNSNNLEIQTPDFKLRSKLKIVIPDEIENTFLDFQTVFLNEWDVVNAKHYFPDVVMDPDVVEWLEGFFMAGTVTQGRGIFYGEISDFPFALGNGVMEVLFEAKAFDLGIHADWPNINAVDADVMFLGESLSITGHYGLVNGVEILHANVLLPELVGGQQLLVQGETYGALEHSLDFMLLSPLADFVKPILEVIDPHGEHGITADMAIPLYENVEPKVDLKVHLDSARLNVLPIDLPVSDIKGDLHFTEASISSPEIQATVMGHPAQVQIQSDEDNTVINISGMSDSLHLQQQFPSEWWQYAEGNLNYAVELTIPDEDQQQAKLNINSDLKGLALNLPEKLAKTEAESQMFSAAFDFQNAEFISMKLNYADQLKAAVNIKKHDQKLFSANILYGEGEIDFALKAGITLNIKRHELNLDDWLTMSGEVEKATDSIAQINRVNFSLGGLTWQQQSLGGFDLHLSRNDSGWQGATENSFMKGNLFLIKQLGSEYKINLDLVYLNLSAVHEIEMADHFDMQISPLDVPVFEINIDKVLWKSKDLGALGLQSKRVENGLLFTQFELQAHDKKLLLDQARWTMDVGLQESYLRGTLELDNFGEFLTLLDFSPVIQDSEAFFDFSFNWSGAPYQFSLSNLNGSLRVDLDHGRVLGVEPGVGRVLGLFDLMQWDRRLRLDFSDLYAEGLTYNRIYGSFMINQGVMKTKDLIVDALPAVIKITGETGLVKQNFNQIVTVMPVVIPIAGTIINRISGIVEEAWTGDKYGSSFINRAQYSVKGDWDNPEVLPIYKNNGLLQKAWAGLTGKTEGPNKE